MKRFGFILVCLIGAFLALSVLAPPAHADGTHTDAGAADADGPSPSDHVSAASGEECHPGPDCLVVANDLHRFDPLAAPDTRAQRREVLVARLTDRTFILDPPVPRDGFG